MPASGTRSPRQLFVIHLIWWDDTVAKPGWKHYSAPGSNDDPPTVDPKRRDVLFISGIYWKPRLVRKGFKMQFEQKTKKVLAGGGPLQPVVAETTGEQDGMPVYVLMTPYLVGDVRADEDVPSMEFYDFEDAPTGIDDDEQ